MFAHKPLQTPGNCGVWLGLTSAW